MHAVSRQGSQLLVTVWLMVMDLLYKGKHCCLWCNISSEEMAQPLQDRGRSQPRTLEGLQEDYQRFQAAGGRLRNAKLYHNVIAPHFFDIPLSQVSVKEQRRASYLSIYLSPYLYPTPVATGWLSAGYILDICEIS